MSFRNFKNWLRENADWNDDNGGDDNWWKGEPEKPEEPETPNIGDLFGKSRPWETGKMNRGDLGRLVKKMYGVWKGIPFNSVKQDPNGGYYFDWAVEPGMIPDMDEIQPGDKIGDNSLRNDAYWIVDRVDDRRNRVYVTPTEDNPILTKVGKGGMPWTDFTTDVHTGEFEKRRFDDILKLIQDKEYFDVKDVKYILMGTNPVHLGGNLEQGGWYCSRDIDSCRGGNPERWGFRLPRGLQGSNPHGGLTAEEIQKWDANALKKMGFAVPAKALKGEMDPKLWDDFVSGGTDVDQGTEVEGENFDDAKTCAKMVLTAKQPQIKMRNWERLYDLWNGWNCRFRAAEHELWEQMKSPETQERFWKIAVDNGLPDEEDMKEAFKKSWYTILNGNVSNVHYRADWDERAFLMILRTANDVYAPKLNSGKPSSVPVGTVG